jgi:hypothetical protein
LHAGSARNESAIKLCREKGFVVDRLTMVRVVR